MARFNADEIFDIARRIEENGETFYRKAAELVQDEQAKKILTTLADWEVRHARFFAELQAETDTGGSAEAYDPEDQAVQYLQAFADGQLFDLSTPPAEKLSPSVTVEEVFGFAIDLEKEAVCFYSAMQEAVPENLGRDRIGGIVKEELAHVRILTKERDKLRG